MLVSFLQLSHVEELQKMELWLQVGREAIPILGKGIRNVLFEVHPKFQVGQVSISRVWPLAIRAWLGTSSFGISRTGG
jgi:hypothetical protein